MLNSEYIRSYIKNSNRESYKKPFNFLIPKRVYKYIYCFMFSIFVRISKKGKK
jgi:hypothetical protein